MTLNYTSIFQGGKIQCKSMKKLGKTKDWAMQRFMLRGDQLQHGKNQTIALFDPKDKVEFKIKGDQKRDCTIYHNMELHIVA